MDVQAEGIEINPNILSFDNFAHSCQPNSAELRKAASLINSAKRPLIIAGGGALRSGASEALLEELGKQKQITENWPQQCNATCLLPWWS